MSEHAATVIGLPLSVVESNLWDVTAWPAFLGDVEWADRSSHERYLFGVRQGRRTFEVPVGVRWQARDHRVTWRELSGPAWRGEMRLTALNGRRTRVALSVSVRPRSLLAHVTEMLGGHRRALDADLLMLSDRLAAIPQPPNPVRLAAVRRIGARLPAAAARREESAPVDTLA